MTSINNLKKSLNIIMGINTELSQTV